MPYRAGSRVDSLKGWPNTFAGKELTAKRALLGSTTMLVKQALIRLQAMDSQVLPESRYPNTLKTP